MTVRLLIADDHEVIRAGLAGLLEGPEVQVVARAANSKECLELAEKHKPDVVLLDVVMPEVDGLDTLQKLREKLPETKVVMFSTYDNPTHVARAVVLGASDYVLKGSPREAILGAIVAAATGQSPSPGGELRNVAGLMQTKQVIEDDQVHLTPRESQVLRHLSFGLSNKEIGESLGISLETVKEHVQNLLRKIGMKDRTQAAVWAARKRLVAGTPAKASGSQKP
jgi:DNA-binding NarL/FixJ family response regulator